MILSIATLETVLERHYLLRLRTFLTREADDFALLSLEDAQAFLGEVLRECAERKITNEQGIALHAFNAWNFGLPYLTRVTDAQELQTLSDAHVDQGEKNALLFAIGARLVSEPTAAAGG